MRQAILNTDQEANNLMLAGLTIEQMTKIPKWLLNNYEKNKVAFDKAIASALLAQDRYSRANEHHIISDILTNDDITSLSQPTRDSLKRRRQELLES